MSLESLGKIKPQPDAFETPGANQEKIKPLWLERKENTGGEWGGNHSGYGQAPLESLSQAARGDRAALFGVPFK